MGSSIDREFAASTVAEPEPVHDPEPVPRRWFRRGRNRVRVPDWSPDALSQALKAGRPSAGELSAPAQSSGFDSLVVPKDGNGSSDTRESQPAQTPAVAPTEAPLVDLRLIVERSVSPLGRQRLRWQDSNEGGEPFGVRESALDALGRLRIRMNEVVYLVPIAADRGFKAVSVTPIGLHLLVADLDTGDLLYEMRHDPAGSW